MSSGVEVLDGDNASRLLHSVDAFLFDCDGVIWKGDKLIDGVSDTLHFLRSQGKKLVFVTNNSTKSRTQYVSKFHSLGISVSQDEIFSSSFAAAMYLKSVEYPPHKKDEIFSSSFAAAMYLKSVEYPPHKKDEIFSSSFAAAMYLKSVEYPPHKKVYVVGGEGISEELHLAGFTALGGPEDAQKTIELGENPFFHHDETVGAVVVGLDQYINFYKLQYATLCIRENPGCLFIATNRDAVGHMTDLQEWPGAGCMVAAVYGSTQKEPIVVGKPSTFMMDFLLKKFDVDTSRMCMVGDRLDTDILFGQSAGCKTLLVLSGVTTLPILQDSSNKVLPDYYTDKVSDLLQLLGP